MEVTIVNFKCWENLTVTFSTEGITLLRGNSGTGKSTILQAIYWCLYGKLNKIYPKGCETACTSVFISLPFMTIFRQRNKTDFYVEVMKTRKNGKSEKVRLVLEEARYEVERVFGSKDVWLSCSYIQQETRNVILTGGNQEKEDLLVALSENNVSESLIAMVKNKISETKKRITKNETLLEEFNKEYKKKYEGVSINQVKRFLDSTNIDELEDSLPVKKKEMEKRLIEKENHSNLIMNQKRIKAEIRKLEEWFSSFKDQDVISDEILDIIRRKENLEGKIGGYNFEDLLDLDVDAEGSKIKEYDSNMRKMKAFKVKSFSELRERISKIEECIDFYDAYKEYISLTPVDKPKNPNYLPESRGIPEPVYDPPVIEGIYVEGEVWNKEEDLLLLDKEMIKNKYMIKELLLSIKEKETKLKEDILICPSCGDHLKYIDKKLHKESTNIEAFESQTKGDIESLKDEIVKINDCNKKIASERENLLLKKSEMIKRNKDRERKIKEFKEKKSKYKKDYQRRLRLYQDDQNLISNKDFNITLKNQYEFMLNNYKTYVTKKNSLYNHKFDSFIEGKSKDELYSELLMLRDIKELKKPSYTMDFLKNHTHMLTLKEELNSQILLIPKEFSKSSYKTLKAINESIYKMKEVKKRNEIKLSELKDSLVTIPDFNDNIDDLRDEIEDIEEKISLYDIYLAQEELHDRIDKINSTLNQLDILMGDLLEYKLKLSKSVSIKLDNLVCDINSLLSSICDSLFEESISVVLNLDKQNKKGVVTNTINFSVSLDGIDYEFSEISSGQRDRVNIALTICLNIISNSPIIIFDESMSYLDNTVRDMAVNCLATMCKDKIVICVNQMGIEGIYDHRISLTKKGVVCDV